MFQDAYWADAGPNQSRAEFGGAYPIEAALDELRLAARDLAFAEAAEMIAQNRITVIDGMIAACEADAAECAASEAAALSDAAANLREERASLAETLPLERAFRADQRDLASARIAAVQTRLKAWLDDPAAIEVPFNPNIAPDEAIALAQEGLACSPEEIAMAARSDARARLYEVSSGEALDISPVAPVTNTYCAAWVAGRLVARARARRH
ncbi:hypothetical protein [Thioclava sp.]|uniref:hypothetical protein n=1 Tax=Thioclava sp. TaxID=1933450 RepID=UPI003AA80786